MTAVYVHEMTSYIEHYGLRRRKLQNGKLEPVGHNHSWVAAQRFTNYLTFNVQIHPDHHIRKQFLDRKGVPQAHTRTGEIFALVLSAAVIRTLQSPLSKPSF